MSFISKLELDDKSYTVQSCNFNLNQQLGSNNKPSGKAIGGVITLTIEFDKNPDLMSWMQSATLTKSGSIIFYNHDGMSRHSSLDFSNAYCSNINGFFNANNNQPILITLTITAETLSINSVDFENKWPSAS